MGQTTQCSVEGCETIGTIAKGWCWQHYQRNRRYGSPVKPSAPPRESTVEKFWRKFARTSDGCWTWQFCTIRGYGVFHADGQVSAHRYSYQTFVGPISEGLTIDHLCRNTRCVNPSHLEPVTLRENIRRAHAHRQFIRLFAGTDDE